MWLTEPSTELLATQLNILRDQYRDDDDGECGRLEADGLPARERNVPALQVTTRDFSLESWIAARMAPRGAEVYPSVYRHLPLQSIKENSRPLFEQEQHQSTDVEATQLNAICGDRTRLPALSKKKPGFPFPIAHPSDVGVDPARLDEVDAAIQRGVDAGSFPGASIGMVKGDKVFHWRHFGYECVEEKKEFKDDTIFRIKSLTKLVTSAAVMMLVERGQLQLDDELSKYIPAFAAHVGVYAGKGEPLQALDRAITIHHLLTHTSGFFYTDPSSSIGFDLPSDLGKQMDDRFHEFWTAPEWYNVLAEVPLCAQPGTKWVYGLGPELLGHVIEVVSGQTLEVFCQENICRPLKMTDTHFFCPESDRHRLAHRYDLEDGKLVNRPHATDIDYVLFGPPEDVAMHYQGGSCLFSTPKHASMHYLGGSGLFSTLADCIRLAMMFANRGELEGARVLQSSTVAQMFANQLPEGVKMPFIGDLGLGHFGFGGNCIPGYGDLWGWSGALSTYLQVSFQHGMAYVLLRQIEPHDTAYALKISNIMSEAVGMQTNDKERQRRTSLILTETATQLAAGRKPSVDSLMPVIILASQEDQQANDCGNARDPRPRSSTTGIKTAGYVQALTSTG